MPNKTLGIIFSNIHDERLGLLTETRATASVPFGGRYRLIDFTLSSMVNAGITQVGVITKQNYQSLMDHLGSGRAWDLARKREGLYILPPMSEGGTAVYRSKIEALNGIAGLIHHAKKDYVLLSDSNLVHNFDYFDLLETHKRSGAQITMMYHPMEVHHEVGQSGKNKLIAMEMGSEDRVKKIILNPKEGERNVFLNTLVMEKNLLEQLLSQANSANKKDFDTDILMANVNTLHISGYRCTGTVRRIVSMKSFFDANMDLLDPAVRGDLFHKERPIFTKIRDEAPAVYGLGSVVKNSLVADGAVIEGEVTDSIIFRGAKIGKGAKISNSIIMQGSDIGRNVCLNYVITDKVVTIKDGRMLMGYESYPLFIQKGSVV